MIKEQIKIHSSFGAYGLDKIFENILLPIKNDLIVGLKNHTKKLLERKDEEYLAKYSNFTDLFEKQYPATLEKIKTIILEKHCILILHLIMNNDHDIRDFVKLHILRLNYRYSYVYHLGDDYYFVLSYGTNKLY